MTKTKLNIAVSIKLQMIFVLIAFVALIALSGCSERIQYKMIRVPVITLPNVPPDMMNDYMGATPFAGSAGAVCFDPEQVKNLQNWMIFHKTQNSALKELLR
jgi:hypothetical protein